MEDIKLHLPDRTYELLTQPYSAKTFHYKMTQQSDVSGGNSRLVVVVPGVEHFTFSKGDLSRGQLHNTSHNKTQIGYNITICTKFYIISPDFKIKYSCMHCGTSKNDFFYQYDLFRNPGCIQNYQ